MSHFQEYIPHDHLPRDVWRIKVSSCWLQRKSSLGKKLQRCHWYLWILQRYWSHCDQYKQSSNRPYWSNKLQYQNTHAWILISRHCFHVNSYFLWVKVSLHSGGWTYRWRKANSNLLQLLITFFWYDQSVQKSRRWMEVWKYGIKDEQSL